MDYYSLYQKYKFRYLQLKGGERHRYTRYNTTTQPFNNIPLPSAIIKIIPEINLDIPQTPIHKPDIVKQAETHIIRLFNIHTQVQDQPNIAVKLNEYTDDIDKTIQLFIYLIILKCRIDNTDIDNDEDLTNLITNTGVKEFKHVKQFKDVKQFKGVKRIKKYNQLYDIKDYKEGIIWLVRYYKLKRKSMQENKKRT